MEIFRAIQSFRVIQSDLEFLESFRDPECSSKFYFSLAPEPLLLQYPCVHAQTLKVHGGGKVTLEGEFSGLMWDPSEPSYTYRGFSEGESRAPQSKSPDNPHPLN